MTLQLQTYPPLGQVTTQDGNEVVLKAVLENPSTLDKDAWEVSLWCSVDDAEWRSSQLDSWGSSQQPQNLQDQSPSTAKEHFSTYLTFQRSIQFTLKFRHGPGESWRWARDELGLDDGVIISKGQTNAPANFTDVIKDLDAEWKLSSHMSQASRTQLWSLETDVPQSKGDTCGTKNLPIGVPWGSFLRYFSLVRLWSPWLVPRQGRSSFHLDKDAVLCAFLSPQGRTVVFLALSGINDVVSVFRHTADGRIAVHARNDAAGTEKSTILVAESEDFNCAVASVMYHARTLMSRSEAALSETQKQLDALASEIRPQWLEGWYDGLGYCTWNALGQRLTEEKILGALDTLAGQGINVNSLIIDDNWQSIDYEGESQFQYGWVEFEAERKSFPKGLKATVSEIRQRYPAIQHIAVWHALLGYWGGISPGGKIAQSYKTITVDREDGTRRNLPLGGPMTVVDCEDVPKYYDDFYKFLSNAGVDAVKTDVQFMLDTIENAPARQSLIKTYLDAWIMSSLRHFSNRTISCMSQFPQALFYSQMKQNRSPFLMRSSDDFFPQIAASHPWHIWTNAHNAILMEHLNVLPDWDMFQTVHEYSGFHAAARCISGGPIYITDVPGEHNIDLIRQMTGVTPRGKTVIFRPSVIGKVVNPYNGYCDNLLLKVGSYHGYSATGTSMLAVFNVSKRPLTELVPLDSFPGTSKDILYVLRAHSTGKVSTETKTGLSSSYFTCSVDVSGFEIFSAFPLHSMPSDRFGDLQVAPLGLLGKMTGGAAIVNKHFEKLENGRIMVYTIVKALGVLGLYISRLPDLSIDDDFMITIQGQPIPVETVRKSEVNECVLEIDAERAWKEMDLKSGWSNEVQIKVFFKS